MLSDTIFSLASCLIDGRFVPADTKETSAVMNPADGKVLGHVAKAGAEETRRAIEAAGKAFPAWKARTALERAKVLMDWYGLMLDNIDELAKIVTMECGKPLAEAKGETLNAASYLRWFAEEVRRMDGYAPPAPFADQRLMVTREPVGVVGIITPWNFPISMIARKVSAALAAGCPVVVRPASLTPFSALALAKLGQELDLPDGLVNVVTGDSRSIGKELTTNKTVRKISFTGSTGIGKLLIEQTASTVKRLSMELGGNAPFIVFEDADLEVAAASAVFCKFRNAGQTCICANRIYVQDSVYDEFADLFVKETMKINVGNGLEAGVTMGPVINQAALEKVEQFTADAVSKGGRVLCGGKRHDLGGLFYEPTAIADASDDMLFAREEIFGPVAPLFRFQDEDEVVRRANDTEFGLASYFFTSDAARTWRVKEALEYGLVGINDARISTVEGPFGGVKESGYGREGSRYGLDDYTVLKYACVGGV